ncbi:MAG: hypothetical protein IPK19_21585 [Chloroflexi bacterium]|nr:hypothetical protein [Chloroflexota bacterium]
MDGLFPSSGIISWRPSAQDKILDTVDIIRNRHRYRGYVHLKLAPGAETDQIRRALELADRISINLEGPIKERLEAAPKERFRWRALADAPDRAHNSSVDGRQASEPGDAVCGRRRRRYRRRTPVLPSVCTVRWN